MHTGIDSHSDGVPLPIIYSFKWIKIENRNLHLFHCFKHTTTSKRLFSASISIKKRIWLEFKTKRNQHRIE